MTSLVQDMAAVSSVAVVCMIHIQIDQAELMAGESNRDGNWNACHDMRAALDGCGLRSGKGEVVDTDEYGQGRY